MTPAEESQTDKTQFLHMPIDPALKNRAKVLAKEKGLKSVANLVRYLLIREIERSDEKTQKPPQ